MKTALDHLASYVTGRGRTAAHASLRRSVRRLARRATILVARAALSLAQGVQRAGSCASDHAGRLAARLEIVSVRRRSIELGIERLKDAEWRLHDGERRYRDLLDAQTDIIARTDSDGRLTFVNRAFCHVFAVEPAGVLGTIWRFTVLEGERPAAGSGPRLCFELTISTSLGARRLAFEETSGGDGGRQLVGRDVTEERAELAALTRARDEAEAANRAKSRFLAAMSHEIRTPMNGILGMTGLLAETDLGPDQRAYTQAIDQSARTLLTIIDEILDLSKIEAGHLEVHPVPFALDHCVQSVVELMAPKAREKGLELVWRIDPDLPRLVVGDETRVRQIVLNLVGNAIKFTDAGGVAVRVTAVAAAPDDAVEPVRAPAAGRVEVQIAVSDTGIGIAEDQQRLIFADFERAQDAVARRRSGTGLGLAISRRLARAMAGDIEVESCPGSGSVFRARLAFGAVEGAGTMQRQGAAQLVRRVLVAVERPLERALLAESLAAHGMDALVVASDPATIDRAAAGIQAGELDLLITDASIGTDSLEPFLSLAQRASGRPLRAIALIDPGQRGDIDRLRAAGLESWLVRPIRPGSLLKQLEAANEWRAFAAETRASAPTASISTDARSSRRTLLLVEDNDINALLARRMGERAGCTVLHARSGPDAVRFTEHLIRDGATVDVVLMDIHMPGMDGYEAARQLRGLWQGAGLKPPPMAALTANAFPEDRRRCLDEGLDDFLAKPFERAELEALLDRWCGDGDNSTMVEHVAA